MNARPDNERATKQKRHATCGYCGAVFFVANERERVRCPNCAALLLESAEAERRVKVPVENRRKPPI